MLNVYFGGADKDKDMFMFQEIASAMPSDIFLLVPDQFTLQAERNAFEYMNADALLEFEVVSRSGFTRRIVSQEGRPAGIPVDKYGRFMLLAKLMLEDAADLDKAHKKTKVGEEDAANIDRIDGKIVANGAVGVANTGEASGSAAVSGLRDAENVGRMDGKMAAGGAENATDAAGRSGNAKDAGGPSENMIENGDTAVGGMRESGGIFAAVRRKKSFLSLMNDMISDLKQYDVEPDELAQIAESFPQGSVLKEKLDDILDVFERYSAEISGRYTDSEDFLRIVSEKIYGSKTVKSHEFWIDGFDYMTPKLLSMVEAIVCTAPKVSIVFTGEDRPDEEIFAIFRRMQNSLREMAQRRGIEYHEAPIPEKYRKVTPAPKIRLTECSDFYAEAETAAVRIAELVREEGMRYRDIVIICNDAEVRGSIFQRVFDRYGIPLFIDRKSGILHDPAVEFIFAMLDVVRNGRKFHDMFRMMKTGYSPLADDACEELENYCQKYRIRSGRWKKPFVYGVKDEGEDKLQRLNSWREEIDAFVSKAEKLFRGRKTVREKTEALFVFLAETAQMPQRIDGARLKLEERGYFEAAESTAQVWAAILSIFDQIVEVIGDEVIPDEEYVQILTQGFSEMEIGLLPPTNDQVIFGTMQRTRTGSIRALFVCGANDGVLPEESSSWGLFTEEEKQRISEKNRRICETDELREMEQQLAMYKMLAKAEEYLFVSWARLDSDGRELRASELVTRMKESGSVPGVLNRASSFDVDHDVFSEENPLRLIQTQDGALPHLTQALRRAADGEPLHQVWKAAIPFFEGQESFENVKKGLFFKNKTERLERKAVRALYGRGAHKELILSASSMEQFSRCPFSFLVSYGLRPQELRNFEVDLRSIGDIYHDCLRRLADNLTEEGVEITAENSRWMTIGQEECHRLTDRFVDEFAKTYREGVFQTEGRDNYVRSRVKEVCFRTAWMMIFQVRSGKTKEIQFERRFGLRSDALFPPVRIKLEDGSSVFIEGIIDRVDILTAVPKQAEGTVESRLESGDDGAGDRTVQNAGGFNIKPDDGQSGAESGLSTVDTGMDGGRAKAGTDPYRTEIARSGSMSDEAAKAAGVQSAGRERTYVRIIDYKSGSEKFHLDEVRQGYRLQLMLYLKGAMGGIEEARPAGVFYFRIGDGLTEVSDTQDADVEKKVAEQLRKDTRLDGIVLNDSGVVDSMDSKLAGQSEILPLYRNKDGVLSGANLLTEDEFDGLIRENDENLYQAASRFASGCTDILPMKTRYSDACRYCGYKSICNIK